jgi:hypothetical protein
LLALSRASACSPGEGDDGKVDASFHSPAYIAAHIASLQARAPVLSFASFHFRFRACGLF